MSNQNLHILCFERANGVGHIFMCIHVNPLLTTHCCAGTHAVLVFPHRVDLMNANGITGAHHSRHIVRLMDVLQTYCQIRLTFGQHLSNTLVTFRGHDLLRQFHHAVDLDQRVFGQRFNTNRSTSRVGLGKVLRHDFIHGSKITQIQ